MNVVIGHQDGSFFLRQFKPGYEPASYEAPEEWRAQSVSVPDHVVVAYGALNAQVATMDTLLMTLLDRANA